MNAVIPCAHPNLHAEIRALAVGEKQIKASFVVCTTCKTVISYMPQTPPSQPDNRIDAVARDVDEIKKHITNINNTLRTWANKS